MTNEQDRRARRELARTHARQQAGLLTRAQLSALGFTFAQVRAEVLGERWRPVGRQTLAISSPAHGERSDWWLAVLECAPRWKAGTAPRAALAGLTALLAGGLQGIADDGQVHVAAPKSSHPVPAPIGVRIHETRRWRDDDVTTAGVVRVTPGAATVQAALWARTDREAALLLISPIQQRLTTAHEVAGALELVRRDKRRSLLRSLLREVDDGVSSLNELDFAALCRARGLPEPDRQVVVDSGGRRAYLDVRWHRWHVVVEIDGIGHLQPDSWVDDSLRHNEIALGGDVVLRIPSLGLRLHPDKHLDVVDRALRGAGWRP